MKRFLPLFAALALLPLPGCLSHAVRVEPITVAPVRVQMDVNLHVDDERPAAADAEETLEDAAEEATEGTAGEDARSRS